MALFPNFRIPQMESIKKMLLPQDLYSMIATPNLVLTIEIRGRDSRTREKDARLCKKFFDGIELLSMSLVDF